MFSLWVADPERWPGLDYGSSRYWPASSIAIRVATLEGLAPLAHRQQRLATVLGSAYWQNLQCIFVMTVQVDEFSTTSLGPLAVTERLGEMRQQLVEVAVADPANQL